jgi:hypothetical protein
VKVGKKLFVTEQDGRERSGRLAELRPGAIVLTEDGTRREVQLSAVRLIQTPDPRWTGALVGAGIGAALSLAVDTEKACPNRTPGCLNEVRAVYVGFPLWGGIFGFVADWLHEGRKTIYRVP